MKIHPRGEVDRGRRKFLTAMAAGILGPVSVGKGTSAVSAWTGLETNSVLNQARPGPGSGALKIVKVEPLILRLKNPAGEPRSRNPSADWNRHFMLCRVETEEGLVGWGEGTDFPRVATVATEIELMKSYAIGQSAFDIELIWNRIYRARNSQWGSTVQSALACIDIALWDIVGQHLGVPVYKLLGGKMHERLAIYTSYRWGDIPRTAEAYAKRTRELVAEGALAGKWDPFFDPVSANRQVSLKTINEVVEMVRGIREGGPQFEICVEAHAKFNVASAARIAKAIEPFNPMYFEEPVAPENPDAMAEVQRGTSVTIAAGERIKSRLGLREYLERQAFRLFQPDAAHVGGITEYRKMAAMAESYFIPVAPHNPNGPVCLAAQLHLSVATPNFVIFEEGRTDPLVCKEWFGAWEDSRAYFKVPEAPGLGIKISEAAIRAQSVPIDQAERGVTSGSGN
jgi:galactonate dehydratase